MYLYDEVNMTLTIIVYRLSTMGGISRDSGGIELTILCSCARASRAVGRSIGLFDFIFRNKSSISGMVVYGKVISILKPVAPGTKSVPTLKPLRVNVYPSCQISNLNGQYGLLPRSSCGYGRE